MDRKDPACLRADVGNVGNPFLVGSASCEIPRQSIGIAVVGAQLFDFPVGHELTGHQANAQLVHQPQHGFVVDAQPLFVLQLHGDAAKPIRLVRSLIDCLHRLQALGIRILRWFF